MAYIERHEVTIVTAAGGTGTGYTGLANGFVQAVRYVADSVTPYDATVDVTITAEASGLTIWQESNVAASKTVYPRAATSDTAGVASLYAAAGEPVEVTSTVAKERIKIEIAQGGNVKSGTFHVYIGG